MTDPPSLLRRLYTLSPEKLVGKIRGVFGRPETSAVAKPVTEAFLRSEEYSRIMSNHLPYDGSYDRHEAQNQTASFRHRHFDRRADLGVFRWRGIQENLDLLLPIVADPNKRVVDLGGAASPLGFGSIVVDRLPTDCFGRPVRRPSLSDVEGKVDAVFSSHTLEHIPEIDETLGEISEKLAAGGRLILHLPSFSCERWRAGVHSNKEFNDHCWTFGLECEPPIPDLVRYRDIRSTAERFFTLEKAEYCGDDSIFLLLRNDRK